MDGDAQSAGVGEVKNQNQTEEEIKQKKEIRLMVIVGVIMIILLGAVAGYSYYLNKTIPTRIDGCNKLLPDAPQKAYDCCYTIGGSGYQNYCYKRFVLNITEP